MIARILTYMERHGMIEEKDKIVVGISGGADSVCLLSALLEYQKRLDFEVIGVHVEHGIRGEEALEDAAFVENLCSKLGVTLHTYSYDVRNIAKEEKLTLEEAGRKARYEAFERSMKEYGGNKIAVAHHKNDQAETMLFHLFRGTGIKGLRGMEPVRGNIIRPLLCVERKEIETYLESGNIVWCTDSTNLEADYSRNKLRLQVIPYVEKEINERAVAHMASTAAQLAEIQSYLEKETEKVYRLCVVEDAYELKILEEPFRKLEIILKKMVFRRGIETFGQGLKDITEQHIELLLGLMEKDAGKQISLPGGITAKKDYHCIRLSEHCEEKKESAGEMPEAKSESIPICQSGTYFMQGKKIIITIENAKKSRIIPENTYTKWFDYDRIVQCLEIRTREQGDYLEINKDHGTKKLKDYFIDCKVPRDVRDRVLLLADGNHILWAVGYRISEAYKVTEDTKHILKVEIEGGLQNG